MSNTRCQALSWLLLPMALVVLLAVTGLVANETLLLYVWTVAVVLAHIHYGVSVVRTHTLPEVSHQCISAAASVNWIRCVFPGPTAEQPLQH